MGLPVWTPTQSLAARAAKRKSNYFLYLNLWPFVTVIVALLFLFMPLTTDDTHGAVAIDRPHARNATAHPHALREDSMHLTITRDGKYFFSSTGGTYQTGTSIEELAPRLRDATKNAPYQELYLDADARCRYSDVKIAVNQIRAAGITNLVILTENPPTLSTPTQ
jgi:biopolymer transport protein ExbD